MHSPVSKSKLRLDLKLEREIVSQVEEQALHY